MENLFENYKNLDIREQIKFDREYLRYQEEKKKENLQKRIEISDKLKSIVDENDEPYFSEEYVNNKILGI